MRYSINYSRVISQANSIEQNAEELSQQIKLLTQMEQECRAVWKGDAADTFIAKLNEFRSEMNRTKNKMSSLAVTIKYCADRLQKAEDNAHENALKLKSGH